MTEQEWLAGHDVDGMLWATREQPNRKHRLFCVACCRNLAYRTNEPLLLRGIEVAERFADDPATAADFDAAHILVAPHADQSDGLVQAVLEALTAVVEPYRCADACCMERWHEALEAENVDSDDTDEWDLVSTKEEIVQAALVRDIFGNPFRPVAFAPAWRTDTAVSLARGMYESRDFSAMPILADALQDAGCEDEQVLMHCRDATASHVRGCWVCDLVLCKA